MTREEKVRDLSGPRVKRKVRETSRIEESRDEHPNLPAHRLCLSGCLNEGDRRGWPALLFEASLESASSDRGSLFRTE